MSDTQRQVQMVAEQALANLVERAKRLQLNSVANIDPSVNRLATAAAAAQTVSESNITVGNNTKKNNPKLTNSNGNTIGPGTQRGGANATARKPRKMELEPSPPPPSPRELCLIAELRDEYIQTDQLIDKLLTDATVLNHDMIYCSQHQRDLTLVQEIELEATHRSLDTLFEALGAECERQDLKDIMHRCGSALERSKDNPLKSFMDMDTHADTILEGLPNLVSITGAIADELLPPESLGADVNLKDIGNISPNKLQLPDNQSDRLISDGLMPQVMVMAEENH